MKVILKGKVECLNCGFIHADPSLLLRSDDGKVCQCTSCAHILIDLRDNNMIIDKVKADSLSFE